MTECHESSGNIFSDLELNNAHNLQARSLIGFELVKMMNVDKKTQKEWGEILGLKQSEISHLLNGHFSRFTSDKLFELLYRMNKKVTIIISPHLQGEDYNQVSIGG